jgi:hypothetical protein
MNFQFRISTLMLAVAVVAIAISGLLITSRFDVRNPLAAIPMLLGFIAFTSPWWVPCMFVGYAVGRASLTVRMVLALLPIEAIAIGIAYFAFRSFP